MVLYWIKDQGWVFFLFVCSFVCFVSNSGHVRISLFMSSNVAQLINSVLCVRKVPPRFQENREVLVTFSILILKER